MSRERLVPQLILHEGLRLKPYLDSVGKLTIGVGRNLDDKGITKSESLFLLENDISDAEAAAAKLPWFPALNDARQSVILDMLFNMGPAKLAEFRRTIEAIEARAYETASERMLDSKWAKQTGKRALRLSEMMRTGLWPPEIP